MKPEPDTPIKELGGRVIGGTLLWGMVYIWRKPGRAFDFLVITR